MILIQILNFNTFIIFCTNPLTEAMSQILKLLTNTLNPSLLQSTQTELQRHRSNQGFATELMMIADNSTIDIKIRQSALIVLKNMIYDQCNKTGSINKNDYEVVKGSILDALARQCGNKCLTPTLRQIIYLIAQIDYPDRWPNIVPTIINNITSSQDFNTVSSSVQALKAIASVCGRSLSHEVTLNNLCNKMVIPLFQLANKLFANYSPETQPILTSIFKIFNLTIFYYLPAIYINNIHSLMIFCKKIVDLSIPQMSSLKISCLKILSRLYSRHTGSTAGYKLMKFARDFHQKYSTPMVQSFIKQLMDSNADLQIINLSLNCLTSIYKNDQKSAQLIDKYHQQLLQLCLLRFKMKKLKTGQSVGSFITHMKQQRNNLTDFLIVMFNSNDKLLGELIQYLNKGDQSIRQLVLYIFSALSQQIQDYPQLHQNMSQFIITFILPILSTNSSSTIMKARGCQIISCYKYVQLPGDHLQNIFQFIYNCLTQNKDSYLNIYALEAFTQLICKYDSFLALIVPYLQQILKVYTTLMKQSNGQVYEVIKSFQLFIGHLNGKDLNNYAQNLIQFLAQLFYQYVQQGKNTQNNQNNQDSSDDDNEEEDEDQNPCHARQGCLACIRQILAIQNLPSSIYSNIISDTVLPLSVFILLDKQLLHFEQCLNILNLCIFKCENLPKNFDQFFKIFAYSILGIPQQLASANLSSQYTQILANVCINPDDDIVSNIVGFFRNFIAKSKGQLRIFKDQLGISFMQYIFKIVQFVQQSKTQDQKYKYKKSDRSLILTLYTTLLQYQFLNQQQFQLIVNNLMNWCAQVKNQPLSQTNVYIQVLLMCVYYNAQLTTQKLNVDFLIQALINRINLFKYQYQLQRLLLGITKLLEKQIIKNQNTASSTVKLLPNIVFNLISSRIKQQKEGQGQALNNGQKYQLDAEQQAQQDLISQNTHFGTFPIKSKEQEKQGQQQLNACEQAQWDQQYNKYYNSPFLSLNELDYLTNVLKSSPYTSILTAEQQEKLTQYLCNAPAKITI